MSNRFKMLSGAAFGAFLLAAATAPSPARAQGFDATALPRVNVSKEIYVAPVTAIYLTTDSVAAAADAVASARAGQGWQRYEQAFSQAADDSSMKLLSLKKGSQLLSVSVRLAPAQGNATAVQYSEVPLANDLPFPQGAADIQFDPSKPYLSATTSASPAGMLAFFTDELRKIGFEPWPENRPGTEREIAAFFLKQSKQPLLVTLQRNDEGKTRIKVESVSPKLLTAVAQRNQDETARPASPQLTAPAPRAPAAPAAKSEIDSMIENTMKEALQIARESSRPQPARPQAAAPEQTLRAMTDGSAPIPVPDTAQGVEHDAAAGNLEFTSPSNVGSVAAFYRTSMKAAGFSERPSVINRPNMAVLTFVKQSKTVTLTVMQMGSETSVRGSGSALVSTTAKSTETKTTPASAPAAQANATPQELEAGEMGGLPVPTRSTQKGTERTRFRIVLNASVPADAASVLAFYRRELGKRDWKEDGAASVAETKFNTPEGPAILALTGKGDETIVKLIHRKPGEAEKAGLLPKPGQAKLVMGNVLDTETTITIDKRTIKVGPQAGARQPDGPMLDLKPGKYTFSFRSGGQPPRTDEVTVAAGETWGILIGPGGALPLQAY